MFTKQSYWSALCFPGNLCGGLCANIYASMSVYVPTLASTCMFACLCTHMPARIRSAFGTACVCMCAFDEPSVLKRGYAAVMRWHLLFAAVLWSGAEGRGQATLTETLRLRAHHVCPPASQRCSIGLSLSHTQGLMRAQNPHTSCIFLNIQLSLLICQHAWNIAVQYIHKTSMSLSLSIRIPTLTPDWNK